MSTEPCQNEVSTGRCSACKRLGDNSVITLPTRSHTGLQTSLFRWVKSKNLSSSLLSSWTSARSSRYSTGKLPFSNIGTAIPNHKMKQTSAARIVALIKSCATKPHGQRARYMAGCHCLLCRAAHARYNSEWERRHKNGITNRIVPANRARQHLLNLSKLGIGRRAVQAATDIADAILYQVAQGKRSHIREETERRILGVDESARSDHSLVDAAPSWKLLEDLTARGYSKAQIARWLGKKGPALQISHGKVLAVQAMRIRQLYVKVEAGLLKRDTPVRLRKGS